MQGDHASISVLCVDDEASFAELVSRYLEGEQDGFAVETATSPSEGLDLLDTGDFDCVVSDYEMPGTNGIEFLEAVRADAPDLPFVLYTGKGSEAVASNAIAAGVSDYLQKGSGTEQFELLANRVENVVSQYHAEQRAERTERQLSELTEATNDVLWLFTRDWGELRYVNSAYEEIWGRSRARLEEDPGDFLNGVHPDDRARVEAAMETASSGESIDVEFRVNADEGYRRRVWVAGEPIVDETGRVVRLAGFTRDVTDRKERELELERKDQIVREMNDGAVITQDGRIEYTSPGVSELTGFAPEALVGTPMEEYVAPEYRETVRERHRRRVAGDGDEPPEMYEIEILTSDGDHVPVEINVSRIDYDGHPATVSIVRDITDRKARERDLEAARRRFEAVFNNRIAFMGLLEPDGTVIEVNDDALDFVDRTSAEVSGRAFWETPWWNHSEALQEDLQEWIQRAGRGELVRFEADHYSPAGDRVTIDGVLHPVRDDDGAVVSILAAGRDISERKRRERQLERQNERLDEFASIVSHDLRNPLNLAEGYLEMAREECASDELDHVEEAHTRMRTLIDGLLTLAREGERHTDVEPVELATAARECWRPVATAEASLVTETDRTVLADPNRLRQLLGNLFRNAVEHGGEGVTVTVGPLDGGFSVADDGRGVPDRESERIFERGYSGTPDGTGFGLSIVHRVVASHGWEIRVTESDEGGARFEIVDVEFGDR